MGTVTFERSIERINEVSARGSALTEMWGDLAEIVTAVVPQFMGPCCFTLDPASLLLTSHFNPAMYYPLPVDLLRGEYLDEDVHDMASVARSETGISTLHEAAGGDPASSPRWRANMELGGDQELLLALRTRDGHTWGCLALYREPGRKAFDREEKRFLSAIVPAVAEAIRRALLVAETQEPDQPASPGLVMLTEELELDSLTPAGARWLSEFETPAGGLPAAVIAVAERSVASEVLQRAGEAALARVLLPTGTWVVLHGAPLRSGGERRVAVIIEAAHPARIQPLLMAAYGLTDREQSVARLVLRGESTKAIAGELVVSPHTVQEHLKRVFEKTGVRSRRDLVGKIFFNHYEPRLRDNERRVLDGRPLRGDPL